MIHVLCNSSVCCNNYEYVCRANAEFPSFYQSLCISLNGCSLHLEFIRLSNLRKYHLVITWPRLAPRNSWNGLFYFLVSHLGDGTLFLASTRTHPGESTSEQLRQRPFLHASLLTGNAHRVTRAIAFQDVNGKPTMLRFECCQASSFSPKLLTPSSPTLWYCGLGITPNLTPRAIGLDLGHDIITLFRSGLTVRFLRRLTSFHCSRRHTLLLTHCSLPTELVFLVQGRIYCIN